MTVKEQQLLDAVDTYVRIANTDKFDAAIWALMADPDTYIHIDAFGRFPSKRYIQPMVTLFIAGAAFGKEEGEAKMKGWLDQGLQMNVVETSVKINTIPGIHEVETKTNFTVATPVLEGMATGASANFCCDSSSQPTDLASPSLRIPRMHVLYVQRQRQAHPRAQRPHRTQGRRSFQAGA